MNSHATLYDEEEPQIEILLNPQNGLLATGYGVQVQLSPNYDNRPHGSVPELIVVHGISLPPNQFGGAGVEQLFHNLLDANQHPYYEAIKDLRVSAHSFIRRDGSVIQFVPFYQRAWHAGISQFRGRQRCNDFSIGIELEGTDCTPYTASQYETLAKLIHALWQAYPSLHEHLVVGHSHIAPGRKTDPGEYFMWKALARLLAEPKINQPEQLV